MIYKQAVVSGTLSVGSGLAAVVGSGLIAASLTMPPVAVIVAIVASVVFAGISAYSVLTNRAAASPPSSSPVAVGAAAAPPPPPPSSPGAVGAVGAVGAATTIQAKKAVAERVAEANTATIIEVPPQSASQGFKLVKHKRSNPHQLYNYLSLQDVINNSRDKGFEKLSWYLASEIGCHVSSLPPVQQLRKGVLASSLYRFLTDLYQKEVTSDLLETVALNSATTEVLSGLMGLSWLAVSKDRLPEKNEVLEWFETRYFCRQEMLSTKIEQYTKRIEDKKETKTNGEEIEMVLQNPKARKQLVDKVREGERKAISNALLLTAGVVTVTAAVGGVITLYHRDQKSIDSRKESKDYFASILKMSMKASASYAMFVPPIIRINRDNQLEGTIDLIKEKDTSQQCVSLVPATTEDIEGELSEHQLKHLESRGRDQAYRLMVIKGVNAVATAAGAFAIMKSWQWYKQPANR